MLKLYAECGGVNLGIIISLAALHGHIPIVQWIHQQHPIDTPWIYTARNAAEGGHLDLLQWAYANGCPLDDWVTCKAAAIGRLDIIQWARSQDCPWDEYTPRYAAKEGHLHVVEWVMANGCPRSKSLLESAATNGHLPVVRWAHENGYEWGWHIDAARNGHLEVLQYMASEGCVMEPCLAACAAASGQMAVVQWAVQQPWSVHTGDDMMQSIVAGGRMDILQWLVEGRYVQPTSWWVSEALGQGEQGMALWLEQWKRRVKRRAKNDRRRDRKAAAAKTPTHPQQDG
jgi:hypothetical protein